MIRDDAKIIMTSTGIVDEALSDEYLKNLMKKLVYTEVMTIFQRVFIILVARKAVELEEC